MISNNELKKKITEIMRLIDNKGKWEIYLCSNRNDI